MIGWQRERDSIQDTTLLKERQNTATLLRRAELLVVTFDQKQTLSNIWSNKKCWTNIFQHGRPNGGTMLDRAKLEPSIQLCSIVWPGLKSCRKEFVTSVISYSKCVWSKTYILLILHLSPFHLSKWWRMVFYFGIPFVPEIFQFLLKLDDVTRIWKGHVIVSLWGLNFRSGCSGQGFGTKKMWKYIWSRLFKRWIELSTG